MSRQRVTALVPCFNNEDIIEECLRSVAWADEVLVCDSYSTDRTVEIAARYADRVLQHEYINSATQKNWAIPQASSPWVLIVDTDERVTPELHTEINGILENPGTFAGFRIPRANHLFGRRLRFGDNWPDYQVRLFRRDLARYEEREVHAHVLLRGECGTIGNPLTHYPHRSLAGIRKVLLQRYTTWEAMERNKRGTRFHWYQLLVRPPAAFVYRYIVRSGYRDSWQGFVSAMMWACYVFITYWKLRALQRGRQP